MTIDAQREWARRNAIEAWMLTTVKDGGVERYDDLHVDRIDEGWKAPETWVEAGLETLRLASALREQHRLLYTLAVAFSLKSQKQFSGVAFQSRDQLIDAVDSSPPSLYLFRPGEEPWLRIARSVQQRLLKPAAFVGELPVNFLGIHPQVSRYFYLEFQQEGSDEYYRSVFAESEIPSARLKS